MSKLLDVNEIKKDFTTNLNQSDKFENTKGILQNFKNFCNNNKEIASAIGVFVFSLLIQTVVTTYLSVENDKKIAMELKELNELSSKRTKASWEEIINDPTSIAANKEVEKIAKESEIYYDFSNIDGVTEKEPNNDAKVTRLNKLKI